LNIAVLCARGFRGRGKYKAWNYALAAAIVTSRAWVELGVITLVPTLKVNLFFRK
jgi:hypothetical protein